MTSSGGAGAPASRYPELVGRTGRRGALVAGDGLTRDQIVGVVGQSFASTVAEAGLTLPPEVGESTPLVGPDSVLDSMALVTLVLDVEQRLAEGAGLAVSLMNEAALSRRRSPFRTVGTLADYILEVSNTGPQAG